MRPMNKQLDPYTVLGIYEGDPVAAWVLAANRDEAWSRAVRQMGWDLSSDEWPPAGTHLATLNGWVVLNDSPLPIVTEVEVRLLTNSLGEWFDGADTDPSLEHCLGNSEPPPMPYDLTFTPDGMPDFAVVVGAYAMLLHDVIYAGFTVEAMFSGPDVSEDKPWPDEATTLEWLDVFTEEVLTALPRGGGFILPRHDDMPDRWVLTVLLPASNAATREGAASDIEATVCRLFSTAATAAAQRLTPKVGAHLNALRNIHHKAVQRGPLHPVDPDLSREAGMDGNYAQLLQAARDLDTENG